jgi:hypothetical protein
MLSTTKSNLKALPIVGQGFFIQYKVKSLITFHCILLVPFLCSGQFAGEDDFDDNSFNGEQWFALEALGSGSLVERNQSIEFDSSGSDTEWQYFAWSDASYDEDFELVFRVANTTMPQASGEFAGIGLEIYPNTSMTTRLNIRLGAYHVTDFGPSRDVLANFFSVTDSVASSLPTFPEQPAATFPKAAAIRVAFDNTSKVFTVYYDANPTDGVQWTQLSTFGVDSDADGANNFDFGLTAGGLFNVFVYARTDNLDAEFGDLVLDDFQAIQGSPVAPTPSLANAAAVNLSTQLGESYSLLRSTDLAADPAFVAVNLIGGGELYRIASESEQGVSTVSGTGNVIQILDPNLSTHEKAFYKIVVQ